MKLPRWPELDAMMRKNKQKDTSKMENSTEYTYTIRYKGKTHNGKPNDVVNTYVATFDEPFKNTKRNETFSGITGRTGEGQIRRFRFDRVVSVVPALLSV